MSTPLIETYDAATGQVIIWTATAAELAALATAQQSSQQAVASADAMQQAQHQDITSRATLVQQAVSAYQQLQSDISGWPTMTTAQKMDATLRTMQTLALAMQVEKLIAQIMQRQGN